MSNNKETMEVSYQEKGRKVKETIDITNMTPKEMFNEIKRVTGKGDDDNS
jgi:broad-specificity NMP kinase